MSHDDIKDSFRFSRPKLGTFDVIAALQYAAVAPIVYLAELYLLMGPLGLELSRLGAMWGVIAAVFVIHGSRTATLKLAIFRMLGTVVGIAIMLIYLAFFPFHVIGLGACLFFGALLCRAFGRNDLVIVTLITIAVIMVDAGNPTDQATWVNPALRFGDSLIGAVSGFLVVAVTSLVVRDKVSAGTER
ncbi:MAG: FUSC family protein [Pseudomonadota bacterium]